MFEEYIEQFANELLKMHYSNTTFAKGQLNRKIEKLKAQEKSDEEIELILGTPENQAEKFIKENCPQTKGQLIMNDIFFFGISVTISTLGTIAMAFIAALCGICGGIFAVTAWTNPAFVSTGQKIAAFFVALCGIVMCVLGLYLTYVIISKMIKSISKHLNERKENLQRIGK